MIDRDTVLEWIRANEPCSDVAIRSRFAEHPAEIELELKSLTKSSAIVVCDRLSSGMLFYAVARGR